MHYHAEVVIPPTYNVEEAVKLSMAKFDENGEDNPNAFWDWYVIGGRWAGEKYVQQLDKDKLEAFYQWCRDEHVTCSGLVCGKKELSPASQIPKVDAKWNELFPPKDGKSVACPLFGHSNDQYGRQGLANTLAGDVARLGDSLDCHCARVIFTGQSYDGELEPQFMMADEEWNGLNYVKSTWDGTIRHALEMRLEQLGRYKPEYAAPRTPNDDWLVVTVDYHS